ncbi:MAG TPA: hypothetical protein DIU15_10890 [Deltaproteobacteria bacterium]|nr:hypothetical protein [Deltaproteobacteria bacterium]HCP46543.1 hypothetical protein [Deltaproteobacteria bacterium]
MLRVAAILALSVGMVACERSELGVRYGDTLIDVVDIHLHTGEWDTTPVSGQETLVKFFPFPIGLQAEGAVDGILSREGLLEQLDRAGIRRGVVLAVYAPKVFGIASNDLVIELLREDAASGDNRLLGMASLRFDRWDEDWEEQLSALDAALAEPNMVGVKLAPPHQHFRMDDPRLTALAVIASNHRAPIYVHTGPSPFPGTRNDIPYIDPAYLEALIAAHPGADFVLGHMGYDFLAENLGFLDTCIALAQSYPNVYLEPSALGARARESGRDNMRAVLVAARDAGVLDRVIYGSDGPQRPGFLKAYLEDTVEVMEELDFTADEATAVLSETFETIYLN